MFSESPLSFNTRSLCIADANVHLFVHFLGLCPAQLCRCGAWLYREVLIAIPNIFTCVADISLLKILCMFLKARDAAPDCLPAGQLSGVGIHVGERP